MTHPDQRTVDGESPIPTVRHLEARRLAGRNRELDTLRGLIRRASSGSGGVVLLGGEAGIGKTSLVDASLTLSGEILSLSGACFGLSTIPLTARDSA